jgi:uncharacterized protein with von Willebrand factor type A (vWA) domain
MPAEIYAPWLDQLDPIEQLRELHERLQDAADAFLGAELEIRRAARDRNRALDLMRDLRHSMRQVAARHGVGLPPTRWAALLDDFDASA